jgi:acetyltransferase-like isoleucine patch superfamily enzyme
MKKRLFRRISNRILHLLARFLPGATSVRPFLHRLRGVKIYGSVFIGDDVYIENEYPHRIEIHDGAQIGLRSIIIAHIRGPGKVIVSKEVWIGANSVIACSPNRTLTIGEGSVISAMSLITSDVPAHTLYATSRTEPVAEVTVPLTQDTEYDQFVRGMKPLRKKKS